MHSNPSPSVDNTPDSRSTVAATSVLAPALRNALKANPAETADPAGMLMAMAERPYVTAIDRQILSDTPKPRRSHHCCRANILIETSSATSATTSQPASAVRTTGTRSDIFGSDRYTSAPAATSATAVSIGLHQRLIHFSRDLLDAIVPFQ